MPGRTCQKTKLRLAYVMANPGSTWEPQSTKLQAWLLAIALGIVVLMVAVFIGISQFRIMFLDKCSDILSHIQQLKPLLFVETVESLLRSTKVLWAVCLVKSYLTKHKCLCGLELNQMATLTLKESYEKNNIYRVSHSF